MRCTSLEIAVASSRSSNVQPLPRYRSEPRINSSIGDDCFPAALGRNHLPNISSSSLHLLTSFLHSSCGERNLERNFLLNLLSSTIGLFTHKRYQLDSLGDITSNSPSSERRAIAHFFARRFFRGGWSSEQSFRSLSWCDNATAFVMS